MQNTHHTLMRESNNVSLRECKSIIQVCQIHNKKNINNHQLYINYIVIKNAIIHWPKSLNIT